MNTRGTRHSPDLKEGEEEQSSREEDKNIERGDEKRWWHDSFEILKSRSYVLDITLNQG